MIHSNTVSPEPESPTPTPPSRLASIDVYRGLVMFLMMAEVLGFARWRALPGSRVWELSCAITSRTCRGSAVRCTT